MGLSIAPDQLATMGSYVAREWGDYGYRFENIESPTSYVSVGHVVCSDGGRFFVAVDRWGNCRHADSEQGWHEIVAELDAKARVA